MKMKGEVLVGDFAIQEMENGIYWITVIKGEAAGEGMEVSKDELEELISKFYAEHF